MKSAAYLTEYILSTGLGASSKTFYPFQRGMNTTEPFWEFLELPENRGYFERMLAAYEGTVALEPVSAILMGFDWTALPADSIVVDVGGGNGSLALYLAQAIPHVKLIVQDRAAVINAATKPVIASVFCHLNGLLT